jgi:hypothetical protein
MWFLRVIRILISFVCGAALSSMQASADAWTATNRPTLEVSIRGEETLGHNDWQVRRAYLSSGSNRMAFVLPRDFRADASDPQKIEISDVQCSCFITIRIIDLGAAVPKELQAADCRELALSRFPGATIENEFTELECLHSGPGFDLRWSISDAAEQTARIVFIPTPVGVVEFSVLSKASGFDNGQMLLRALMLSVRSNESGPLKVSQVFDRT